MKKLSLLVCLSALSFSTLINARTCDGADVTISYGGYSSVPMSYKITLSQGSFDPQGKQNDRQGVVTAFESETYRLYKANKNIEGTIVITTIDSRVRFNIPFHFRDYHGHCEITANTGLMEQERYQAIVSKTGLYLSVSTGLKNPHRY